MSVGLIVLALLALWLLMAWRGLVAARDAADATWAAIDVHLQERHALVPALVAAVQAETASEAQTLGRLSVVREQAIAATTPWERADAERRLVAGVTAVALLAERHPGLGAAAAFVDLQARLADIEDQIQAARRIYNADVRLYRGRRSRLPGSLLKRLGDFDDRPYFELDHTRERGLPTLAFARA
ncbi:LemA family protein [Baekduia alba]|uniref:LemA family protein n=1 Tax=Baekduia alba TaxID=2997333 RepID=UPI0023409B8C|nr:LemA family protein [Baekduia alba]